MDHSTGLASSSSDNYQLSMQELDEGNIHAAQVYATLCLEEAIRDLAATLVRCTNRLNAARGL